MEKIHQDIGWHKLMLLLHQRAIRFSMEPLWFPQAVVRFSINWINENWKCQFEIPFQLLLADEKGEFARKHIVTMFNKSVNEYNKQ